MFVVVVVVTFRSVTPNGFFARKQTASETRLCAALGVVILGAIESIKIDRIIRNVLSTPNSIRRRTTIKGVDAADTQSARVCDRRLAHGVQSVGERIRR